MINKLYKRQLDGTEIIRLVNSRDDFWAEHLKATSPRMEILDLLKESYKPLSIVEIKSKVEAVHLVTIYRTLNHLLKMGIIRKLHGLNRKQALFEIKPVLFRKDS
ncbi:MAG: transcriptional repressor [Candidatus Taylorbacteria bacterium]|nr:transcriptional repressor [Candidatus Taylorbacteria bacterium]